MTLKTVLASRLSHNDQSHTKPTPPLTPSQHTPHHCRPPHFPPTSATTRSKSGKLTYPSRFVHRQSSQIVLLSACEGLPEGDDDTELDFGLELRESCFGRSRVSTAAAFAVAQVWALWECCLFRAGGVMVAWVRGERLGVGEETTAMAVGM